VHTWHWHLGPTNFSTGCSEVSTPSNCLRSKVWFIHPCLVFSGLVQRITCLISEADPLARPIRRLSASSSGSKWTSSITNRSAVNPIFCFKLFLRLIQLTVEPVINLAIGEGSLKALIKASCLPFFLSPLGIRISSKGAHTFLFRTWKSYAPI